MVKRELGDEELHFEPEEKRVVVVVVVGVRINRLWCPPGGPAALLLLPVDENV